MTAGSGHPFGGGGQFHNNNNVMKADPGTNCNHQSNHLSSEVDYQMAEEEDEKLDFELDSSCTIG